MCMYAGCTLLGLLCSLPVQQQPYAAITLAVAQAITLATSQHNSSDVESHHAWTTKDTTGLDSDNPQNPSSAAASQPLGHFAAKQMVCFATKDTGSCSPTSCIRWCNKQEPPSGEQPVEVSAHTTPRNEQSGTAAPCPGPFLLLRQPCSNQPEEAKARRRAL